MSSSDHDEMMAESPPQSPPRARYRSQFAHGTVVPLSQLHLLSARTTSNESSSSSASTGTARQSYSRAARPTFSQRPTATTNYPPAGCLKQRYRTGLATHTLVENCNLLGVEIIESGHSSVGAKAGRGLRAVNNFDEGQVIGWLWGKFVAEEMWTDDITNGRDPTHIDGAEDYVQPALDGIWRCLHVPQQECGATLLIGSEQCPMVLINSGDPDLDLNVNVSINIPDHRLDATINDPLAYQYIEFVACKTIYAGQELLTQYEWDDAAWAEVKKRVKNASSSSTKSSMRQAGYGAAPAASAPVSFGSGVSSHGGGGSDEAFDDAPFRRVPHAVPPRLLPCRLADDLIIPSSSETESSESDRRRGALIHPERLWCKSVPNRQQQY